MITPTPEFWKVFKETNGALSCTEAVAIMNLAAKVPKGVYIELGTYKGKSAYAASRTLPDGQFYLVEPEFNKSIDPDIVERIVWRKGVNVDKAIVPMMIAGYSVNIIDNYAPYSYVFVDSGSHQDGLPMQEVQLLEDKVISGGIIAFHDFQSQFKEVTEAHQYLIDTGKYENIPIEWNEIVEYVNANNLEEGNSSWHHTELKNPCFVGAVKRK